MMWTNPLDRIPQIPQDWANHIAQGGIWMLLAMAALQLCGASHYGAMHVSFWGMFAISVLKKVVDYFLEHESWQVCLGKALVTMLWPASLLALY